MRIFAMYVSFFIFHFEQNFTPVFSCEKILLNITHARKGFSKFPHTVLYSADNYMIKVNNRNTT